MPPTPARRIGPTPAAIAGAAAIVSAPVRLLAHEGHRAAWSPSVWDAAAWTVLAVAGIMYAVGSRRLARRAARVRRFEPIAFWTGWAAFVLAVAPPLDRAAAFLFSAHMLQHELLTLVGAPLAIAGRPILRWTWALPRRVREGAASGPLGPGLGLWRRLTAPMTAWALHGVTIWIWHLPGLYEAAVRVESVHALQHAMFVSTAAFFWWGLIYGRYGRAAYGASALYVFTTMIHTGALGALFTFSGTAFYALYAERARAQGLDPIADQQLAGLYMWIPAGLVFLLFGLALVLAWLSEAERRTERGSPATR